MMRIAFIGLGSIAKRHIGNLNVVLDARGVEYEIDVYRHSSVQMQDDGNVPFVSSVYSLDEWGCRQYDVAFITNPTALHYETIKRCVGRARHLFIEKPVFDRVDADVTALPLRPDGVYYVACPMRYIGALQYIRKHVDLSDVYAVRAICSSYLPEWRSEVDYCNTYSAQRCLGGGVEMDLIHEWDYIVSLFGFPEKVLYAGGKYSALEIDTDDLATYIGIYSDKLVELHLDYFGRAAQRELQLFLKEDTVRADLIRGSITFEKEGRELSFEEERNVYQRRELEHFFDIIEGKCENDSDIVHAARVLELTKGIEMGEDI